MDRALYIAMSGARESLYAQAVNNHNLANANTTGFRQVLTFAYTRELRGPVYPTRDFVQNGDEPINFAKGTLQATGRDLDVAIQGDGFFAIQALNGGEVYTRAGELQIDPNGALRTTDGQAVLGDGGPITIPPAEKIVIGRDGTISIRPLGAAPNALATLDRLRLVNPPTANLERGEDGLFRTRDGAAVAADANVRIVTGMLETSNVNTVEALTRMIELSRHYETQVKMMSAADNLAKTDNRLLGIS
ncbi:flagellar basal-body rod protein FlgF [Rhodoferax sp. 4810]|uniref:Flagellar basal-body rod protein FlgF n=1 Tax=Thiospirillum jenense TaxID=1653858 RepID=A0A839HF15_9GAMM|nr:flagellar basal-body rod protein FlgF [Thiospirillum jenense]MBB1073952.1 flagellar basal-body rod protein FlgF [Rhodoferax jenense]MBB1125828.1 flagellar basal-body rod protein FlgF [Thiospirillum jenense]